MIIDCDGCAVRGVACGDCVIGVLLGSPAPAEAAERGPDGATEVPSGAPIVQLDAPERRALAVLADQGLVPKLRLVAAPSRRARRNPGNGGAVRDAG
ncbi:MAG TPA: hypothetical protein VKZ81_26710 [Pseudonocardia sp.]|mgnify:CR=1 FL=1|jgi:hypothetical protein|uniref:hypothetical protein n=1 Tax=Pseudonocardia sp. TaxID=60912 RepID=UPI002B4AE373|nr:hypothetical protein [Pseudonocardia sp.]HLU59068.1 hypothetical protein [Pseudonocardia sp.]